MAIPAGALAGGGLGGGPAGGLYYFSGTVALPEGGAAGRGVICSEPGTRVIGGGFDADNSAAATGLLRESYPYDSIDSDSKPDDGWWASAQNVSSQDTGLSVYAICGFDSVKYVSEATTIPPGKARTLTATCPDKSRGTAGGLQAPHSVGVSAVYPVDGADNGAKRDDGWAVKAVNRDPAFQTQATVHAICIVQAKMAYTVFDDSDVGAGTTFDTFSGVCEGGTGNTYLTGGGLRINPPFTARNARITAMVPLDYAIPDDPDTVPSDALGFQGSTDFAGQKTVDFFGACVVRSN